MRVDLLGHMVTLDLIFEELSSCFTKQPYHFTFLPAIFKGSDFSTFSPTLINTCPFDSSRSSECEVYLNVGLICVSQMTNIVEHLFKCIGSLYIFFGQMSIYIICLFLTGLSFSLALQVLYTYSSKSLIKYVVYKCFFPIF